MAIFPIIVKICRHLSVISAFGFCISPSSDPAEEWRLVSQIRHSDRQRAIQIAKAASENANGYSDAWHWRFGIRYAELLLDSGDTESAAVEIQKMQKRPSPQGLSLAEKTSRLASAQGYLRFSSGEYQDAERLFEQAIVGLPLLTDDLCWLAELRTHHQAQSLRRLLNFAGANESLQKAKEAAQSCSDKTWLAMIPFIRGNCYNDQFRFEEAVQCFQQCYQVASRYKVSQMMGSSLGNIGLSYHNLGDTDRALTMFDEASAYYKSLGKGISPKDLRDHGSDVGHEARTYFLLNNYDKAESKYKEAIEIATKTGDHIYLPRWRVELASLLIEKGSYGSAETLNEEVLNDSYKDHPSIEIAHVNKARLDRLQGRFKEAEKDLDELQGDSAAKKDAKIQWQLHIERAQLLSADNHDRQANSEFQAALRTADAARSAMQISDYRLTFFRQLQEIYEKYVHFLVEHKQTNEALRVAESSHARMLAEKLNHAALPSPAVDFLKIARAKNSVILSYSITSKDSYVWITTPEAIQMMTLPAGTSEKVERLIAVHNEQIRDQQQPIEGDQGGPQLYNLLVSPVAQWIPTKSNVIIIPDGSLSSLNFETLIPPGGKPHYWIEDVTITVAPSLAQLTAEAQPTRDPGSILLVGDVVPTSQEKLPPLSPDDLDYLTKLYASSDVLKKEDATPSAFLKRAKTRPYSWIYVSAHAISNPQSPLDSYIVLSPETKGGDYKLSARELAELGLRANLVTLSACQSAGAKNVPGEGLVGLSWGVLSAGARNVVASLWSVEASSTSKLMKKFYRHLHEHEAPERALRSAKLEMMKERNLPYTWAAFQLYSR